MTKNFSAYLAAFVSTLFWGASFVWTKELLDAGLSPIFIVTFRILIASTVLFTVFKLTGKLDKIHKKDYKLFLLLGFFEPFLYFIGENYGLQYVSPSIGAIIIATIPVFVPFGLRFFNGEKLRWQIIFGVVLSILGIGIMSVTPQMTFIAEFKGISLLFLAVFAAVAYNVVLAKILVNYKPITVTTYQNIIGSFLYLPLFLALEGSSLRNIELSIRTIYPLLSLAILCSSIAFICFSYSARKLTVAKTSAFTNGVPVITILFSAILGLEDITLNKVLGISIVITGLFLSQMNFKKNKI